MSEPNNAEVINALSASVNFSFSDKTGFGALFGSSENSSQSSTTNKGIGNTAFGSSVLSGLIDTSKNNSAFGSRGQLSSEGDSNSSFGFESMLFLTKGNQNSGFGTRTFDSLSLGDDNIAFGFQAGKNISIGSGNICIGNSSRVSRGDINNSIILGNDAEATDDNQFVVGSVDNEAGKIESESLTSTQTWSVVINGVARKILLA
jgi:hypothetical protein